MMKNITFAKMSGAGNDFVVIDNRQQQILHPNLAAQRLCDRRLGIGGDGMLLVEKSRVADFTMKYYNADGSSSGMCGNGGRCIAMFAFKAHIVSHRVMQFDAFDHVYRAEVTNGDVVLSMKDPRRLGMHKTLSANGLEIRYHVIDTGTEHCVILMDENPGLFGEEFEQADITALGRTLRYHEAFAPIGTNVNFVGIGADGVVVQRTYERGVEDETLACGTGSVASSIIAHKLKKIPAPVTVRVRSGEDLHINFADDAAGGITGVTLQGSARIVYEGTISYDTEQDVIG